MVPGGGLSDDHQRWVACRPGFFLPVRVLSRLFRRLFLLEYLGRYTHRVAISNQRLVALEDGPVSFHWKDYRHHHQPKGMTIPAEEFIRRFLLHTLPPRFQRIRPCGLLANRHRRHHLAWCRQRLSTPVTDLLPQPDDAPDLLEALTGESDQMCPQCGAPLQRRILFAYRWPAQPPDSSGERHGHYRFWTALPNAAGRRMRVSAALCQRQSAVR